MLLLLHHLGAPRAFSATQLHWRNGHQVCSGKWQYYPVNRCRLPAHGVESYQSCRHQNHGVELYLEKASASCGVLQYRAEENADVCGTYEEKVCETKIPAQPTPGTLLLPTCTLVTFANTCEDPSFGVQSYQSCRHRDHGPESYFEKVSSHCPVQQFKEHFNSQCASELTQSQSGEALEHLAPLGPEDETIWPLLVPFEGLGSSCSTCDDLPVSTPMQRSIKFDCLYQAIKNAEEEKEGFGLVTLRESVAALKELFALSELEDQDDNPSLTEEQRDYVLYDLSFLYPTFRYDNPELFRDSFRVNINFTTPSGTAIAEFINDFGSRFRRKSHLVYGWKEGDPSSPTSISEQSFELEDTSLLSDSLKPFNSYLEFKDQDDLKWEIKLPNGNYRVTVGSTAGDHLAEDHTIIHIEGEVVLDYKPNHLTPSFTASTTISLEDGHLTLDGKGSQNGKISFITIEAIK